MTTNDDHLWGLRRVRYLVVQGFASGEFRFLSGPHSWSGERPDAIERSSAAGALRLARQHSKRVRVALHVVTDDGGEYQACYEVAGPSLSDVQRLP